MEVKIPKDILRFEESVFFGLSLRQFLFSLLAVAAAVGAYFIFNPIFGLETTSWICILVAVPFAALGFVRYNGMSADHFARTWIHSEILFPKVLVYQSSNLYMDMIEQGRLEDSKPKRKTRLGKANAQADKLTGQQANMQAVSAKPIMKRREKDFERRGRNIYKFRKRGMK